MRASSPRGLCSPLGAGNRRRGRLEGDVVTGFGGQSGASAAGVTSLGLMFTL